MIGKRVVKETVMALEDMIDYIEAANTPELQERLGEVQALLNFWRMYLNFLPEEDSAC